MIALGGGGALVGTPEEAVELLQPLVAAGCPYFTFAVFEPDTLSVLAERVVPQLVVAESAVQTAQG